MCLCCFSKIKNKQTCIISLTLCLKSYLYNYWNTIENNNSAGTCFKTGKKDVTRPLKKVKKIVLRWLKSLTLLTHEIEIEFGEEVEAKFTWFPLPPPPHQSTEISMGCFFILKFNKLCNDERKPDSSPTTQYRAMTYRNLPL